MSDGESSPPAQLSNEDLMRRLRAGDKDALEQLCEKNIGLIRKIAWGICWSYNIDQVDEQGFTTEYTRQMRMELTSVGMTAFITCLLRGQYDPDTAQLSTYVCPFIGGAMRRYLETNLHAASYDRDSMTLARKAQALYFKHNYNMNELAVMLSISAKRAAACLNICLYPDQSLNCDSPDEENEDQELLDLLPDEHLFSPPEVAVYHRLRSEYLQELFLTLPRKERDVLGPSFGLFGYEKESTADIAMFQMITEDAVQKIKKTALKRLQKNYSDSKLELWEETNDYLKYTERIKP